jgi:hypothetical protein
MFLSKTILLTTFVSGSISGAVGFAIGYIGKRATLHKITYHFHKRDIKTNELVEIDGITHTLEPESFIQEMNNTLTRYKHSDFDVEVSQEEMQGQKKMTELIHWKRTTVKPKDPVQKE